MSGGADSSQFTSLASGSPAVSVIIQPVIAWASEPLAATWTFTVAALVTSVLPLVASATVNESTLTVAPSVIGRR